MSGTAGNFFQWNDPDVRLEGQISTTDSAGLLSCITSSATLKGSFFTYSGAIQTVDGVLSLPDLTNIYPDETMFQQCTYVQTGPPPVALTPANEIQLPASTLPRSNTPSKQTTSASPTVKPTTTARPADNSPSVTPSRTSTTPPAVTQGPPAEEPEDSHAPPTSTGTPDDEDDAPAPSPSPNTTNPPAGTNEPPSPGQSDDSPAPSPQDDTPDDQNDSPAPEPSPTNNSPPAETDELPSPGQTNNSPAPSPQDDTSDDQGEGSSPSQTTANNPAETNGSPPASLPGNDTPDEQGDQPGDPTPSNPERPEENPPPANNGAATTVRTSNVAGSAVVVTGIQSGTRFSVLPSPTGGDVGPAGQANPPSSPAPITNAPVVQPITTAALGVVLPGLTLSNGGQGVAVSGTTFSALPSGAGVVAVSGSGSTTLQSSQLAAQGISTVSGDADAFVLPTQTLAVGGPPIIISGSKFSALPQGSGIAVAANGGSSVLSVAEATSLSGVGKVRTADNVSNGYVLAGSVTISAGGAAATIAGTTYSALPQGSGIAVAASGDADVVPISGTTSIAGIGEVRPVDKVANGYILDGSITAVAGGAPVTISGTAYSALPSGLGVLVAPSGDSDDLASYIAQGVSGEDTNTGSGENDTYIIGGELISAAATKPIIISGVVYSVLPSGAGVLVVANGESTTLAVSKTQASDGNGGSTATGGSNDSQSTASVVPYEGGAAARRQGAGCMLWVGCVFVLAAVVIGL